jgi:hypothetical protein
MAKIGRNDPCPCGSGKKYKKCCLGNEMHPTGTLAKAMPEFSPSPPADAPPCTAYVLAKLFEKSELYTRMKRREPKRARRYCTPGEVAKLSTEAIVAHLGELGVDASREAYLSHTEGQTSAWAIAQKWRRTIDKALSRYDEDFVGLGACELWKRYCPERPSVEMLDDWMQEGYELMAQGEYTRACDRWHEVWEHIRPRLHPEMRTAHATASAFNGSQYLFNWIQDYVLELHNVAVDERRYAEQGRELCQAVLAQFPDESELFRINFRADLGEFHYMLGEDEQGERVMLELIRDHSDCAAGYARLADILGYGPTRERGPIDVPRALELLERALARPVDDAEKYDLAVRLRDLQKHARHQNRDVTPRKDDDTGRATKTTEP